jgi:hypothetical protein
LAIDIPILINNELEKKQSASSLGYSPKEVKTISDWCWDALEHPYKRIFVILGAVVLGKHLLAPKILRKYDPIGIVSLAVKVLTRGG